MTADELREAAAALNRRADAGPVTDPVVVERVATILRGTRPTAEQAAP